MIVICLSDTADRFHGFLRSVMMNVHPGVYVSMDLDAGSRDRIWTILERWWEAEPQGMAVMIHRDKDKPMGMDFRSLGAPKRTIVEYEDHYALHRKTTETS
ncbi:type I-E CRISPR-associated endoribonuclease Cas2e [Azospirillum halopraeferens]|uniref:type I-E CRISPR-associated endoribonuclease Cas2e n=1 Tax=Azospirillum halopraeferens TaxID=34010 RepID=UPI000421D204|nr:type I-E CRISPR-associated endoribonuclease Cas2e [Azospirillum halopraeferens]